MGSSIKGLRICRYKHSLWVSTDEHLKLRNSNRTAWKWNERQKKFILHRFTGSTTQSLMASKTDISELSQEDQERIMLWLMGE